MAVIEQALTEPKVGDTVIYQGSVEEARGDEFEITDVWVSPGGQKRYTMVNDVDWLDSVRRRSFRVIR